MMKTIVLTLNEKEFQTIVNALNADFETCDSPTIENEISDTLNVIQHQKDQQVG